MDLVLASGQNRTVPPIDQLMENAAFLQQSMNFRDLRVTNEVDRHFPNRWPPH
jgi:hypothetical protein